LGGSVRAEHVVTTFDVPGADNGTYPYSINATGHIAGYYATKSQGAHSFIRAYDGTVTTFDPPGSTVSWALAINSAGIVAGEAVNGQTDNQFAYLRNSDGSFTTFNVQEGSNRDTTVPQCINDNEDVAGFYSGFGDDGKNHGFIRTSAGTITTFDVGSIYPTDTQVVGINIHGDVAGIYAADGFGDYGGFVRRSDGKITEFAPPGAQFTFVTGINSKGEVTGYFSDGTKYLGFVRARDGTIRIIDLGPDTWATSINSKGMIAGEFVRSGRPKLRPIAFVLRTNGALRVPIHNPNSSVTSMNDGGATTGNFRDDSGTHGFLSD